MRVSDAVCALSDVSELNPSVCKQNDDEKEKRLRFDEKPIKLSLISPLIKTIAISNRQTDNPTKLRKPKEEITQPPQPTGPRGDEDHNPQQHRKTIAKTVTEEQNLCCSPQCTYTKNDENLTELTHALKQIKWDIVGLSEVRRRGERIISHPDFLLYHIGTTPGQYGVGFIIKNTSEIMWRAL
ncbi:hypothetical protein EVAR_41692_1 [Eumeta japonica]|uniref:Endonuclease/exonuclease/phosphatase domain-containing protein n=1 Tax=Eumeta variegata TaxID=151549 RepID=A0A4C1VQE0_EUMVA|nr:hypothetical protein EVAR_41692_1 [Eumeta japonica]